MTTARAAIVLAAGHASRFKVISSRMGTSGGSEITENKETRADKLLLPFRGHPLLWHAIAAARAAPVERIVIVKRSGAALDALCAQIAAQDARIRAVELDSDALSRSLQAGLAAAGAVAGAFIFLGDMPLVPHEAAGQLAEAIGSGFAAIPTHGGQPGHPVLLSAEAIALIGSLSGDQGAGRLLRGRDDVVRLTVADAGVIRDVDTAADYQHLSER